MKVLLLQMPFFCLDSPNIGLESLRASLLKAGIKCDIRYLNIEFCRIIGVDIYKVISEEMPQHFLLGDAVFCKSLYGNQLDIDKLLKRCFSIAGYRGGEVINLKVFESLESLSQKADEFICKIIDDINWDQYNLVGLSTIFYSVPSLAFVKALKKMVPNAPPTILGGSNCAGDMGRQLIKSYSFLDYICRGEGEELIVELVNSICKNFPKHEHINGLLWKDSIGEPVCNGTQARVIDELDKLETPEYSSWINQLKKNNFNIDYKKRLVIETSRGCWYGEKCQCVFCGLNGESIRYREKSPERAISEFSGLKKYGIKSLNASDNILSHSYFNTVIPLLINAKFDYNIFYETKANLSYDQLKSLQKAGITWIQPGIESLSTPILKLMRKGVNALQNVRLLKWASELGIGVSWNILYGLPNENPEEYNKMAELVPAIQHLQPPVFSCNKIRLDRFSPLFELHHSGNVGIKNVKPYETYNSIYPFDNESLNNLAYYFEFDYIDERKPAIYSKPLQEAVNEWKNNFGNISFTCCNQDSTLYLFDSRDHNGTQKSLLRNAKRDVYLRCANGIRKNELIHDMCVDKDEIEIIISEFVENKWIVVIDGKLLSLAINMDRYIPVSCGTPLLEAVSQGLYCATMKQLKINRV